MDPEANLRLLQPLRGLHVRDLTQVLHLFLQFLNLFGVQDPSHHVLIWRALPRPHQLQRNLVLFATLAAGL